MTAGMSNRAPSHELPRKRPWGLLSLIGIALLVVAAGIVSRSGSTFALWNGSVSIPSQQITSGSFGIEASALSSATDTALFPGESSTFSFSITNTGDAAAKLSARLEDSSSHLQVGVSPGTCEANASLPGESENFDSLPAKTSKDYCLSLLLLPSAPEEMQGAPLDFTVLIDALQEVRAHD